MSSSFLTRTAFRRAARMIRHPLPSLKRSSTKFFSSLISSADSRSGVVTFGSNDYFLLVSTTHNHQQQPSRVVVVRWKHPAKTGQHLARLDAMAHEKEHDEAAEKRKRKKAKKAARKSKKSSSSKHEGEPGSQQVTAMETEMAASLEEWEDDLHHYEEEEKEEEDRDVDQDILPDPQQTKARMLKIVDSFVDSLKAIRGAEPTPEFFDNVMVEAYGTNTPLKAVAQVVIVSPTLATATCFDPALAKSVSFAISYRLNLNPSIEDGGIVKIPLPRVSMETRQKTAAALNKRAESYRQGIRKVRRRAMDTCKKGVAGKLEHVSKDDAFRVQQEIEANTEQAIQNLNQAAEEKHKSIMEV